MSRLPSLVVVLFVAACVGDDPSNVGGTKEPAPDGGTSSGAFALLSVPSEIVVTPGESVALPVTIQRTGGFSAPVEVTIEPLPIGIAAAKLVLKAGEVSGDVKLTAAPGASQSAGTVQVVAAAEPATVDKKEMTVRVRGLAGDRDVTFGDKGGNVLVGGIVPRAVARMNDDGVAILGEGLGGHSIGRVLPSGKTDPAFGTNGVAALTESVGWFSQLLVQRDGKLLAAGRSDDYKKLFIHRLLPSGAYDTAFGTNGVATVALDNGFFGIAIDESDRILVGSFPARFRRLTSEGKADATFQETLSTASEGWQKLLVRESTPIAVGFASVDATSSTVGVSVITSPTSKVEKQFDTWQSVNIWSSALDLEGRIVVAGSGTVSGETGGAAYLLRAKANGVADEAFAFGSVIRERFGAASDYTSFDAVLVEPSGKILCVGASGADGVSTAVLVRYDTNGKRDLGFGEQGVVKETKAPGNDAGGAVLQTSLATVVVARRFEPDSTVLLRYWR